MTSASLAPLSIAILGLLFGILLSVIGIAVVALVYTVHLVRRETLAMRDLTLRTLARNTTAIDRLRSETSLALSGMDVNRMHEASQVVQTSARSLGNITGRLAKLLFTQPGLDGTVDAHGNLNDGLLGGAGFAGDGGLGGSPRYPDASAYDPFGPAPGTASTLDDEARQDAAQIDQWRARRQATEYDAVYATAPIPSVPSRSPFHDQIHSAPPQFAEWQREQALKQAAAAGHQTPLPVASLPDLEDAHDLDAQLGEEATAGTPGTPATPAPDPLAGYRFPGVTDSGRE